MPRILLAVPLLALGACVQSTVAMTPVSPGEPARAAAQRACVAQAERQGLDVRAVSEPRAIPGFPATVIEEIVHMQVSRHGQEYPVRCSFDNERVVAHIFRQ